MSLHPASPPTAARDLFAGLLPVDERVLGPEHPRTLADRANLAGFTGEAGIQPLPGTCSPDCCRCASGFSALSGALDRGCGP